MIAIVARGLAVLLGLVPVLQAPPVRPAPPASMRFTTVDIYVDAGTTPLAAWQVEFAAEAGDVTVVGIEGGAHTAFRKAPYYDPKALKGGRVIVAAFSTKADLPVGRTRVARLHLQVSGAKKPQYVAKLQAASNRDGQRIDARVTLKQGE